MHYLYFYNFLHIFSQLKLDRLLLYRKIEATIEDERINKSGRDKKQKKEVEDFKQSLER